MIDLRGRAVNEKAAENVGRNDLKLHRRTLLRLAAGAVALPALSSQSKAEGYPSRPTRVIVGFAPGGGNDIVARLMAQWLSDRLGQSFIVENRPGAGTNIATEFVIGAAPDGYTLLLAGIPNAVNATLYQKLNFNFMRDTTPIVGIASIPNVMLINPSFPAKTLPDFIAYAKENPGKVNMASPGVGSGGHLSGELFKYLAGVNLVHVPFRGNGPALTALLGGQVDVLYPPIAASIQYIESGKLVGLGVTGAKRAETLPKIPAIGEFVPGYAMDAWYGLSGPKGTSDEVAAKINKEVNAALTDPQIRARIADLGGTAIGGSPADFGKYIADETEKWAKVVPAAHMTAE